MSNKKDYTYIASVEKAITEKYGKETVQDFRSDWSKEKEEIYLSQLKSRNNKKTEIKNTKQIIEAGDAIIRKRAGGKKPSRTCPVCKTYSFSSKDDLYMNRFQCCYRCYVDFVEGEEQRWRDGWRPTDEILTMALSRRKK